MSNLSSISEGTCYPNLTSKVNGNFGTIRSISPRSERREQRWLGQKENRKQLFQTPSGRLMEAMRTKPINQFIDHSYSAIGDPTKPRRGHSADVMNKVQH